MSKRQWVRTKLKMYYYVWCGFIALAFVPQGDTLETKCSEPYSCMQAGDCSKAHNTDDLSDQVLFQCGRNHLCCPPKLNPNSIRTSTVAATQGQHAAVKTSNHLIQTTTSLPQLDVHGYAMPWEHRNKRLLPDDCGSSYSTNRIIEGDDASVGEYPWMALIGFTGFNGATGFVCGGTLINERYVLTAAHCLRKDGAKLTHVRLGEHDLSSLRDCEGEECIEPAIDFAIEKIITHEKWDNITYRHDIGLIRLNNSVKERGLTIVAPICLPLNRSDLIAANKKFEAVGWGLTGWREHALSDILQKTLLDYTSLEACNSAICQDGKREVAYCPIISSQMCVLGARKRDVCKGDSGGPLMTYDELKTIQVGITSFKATEICGEENIPSVFTRLDKYTEWILDNLEP